MLIGFPYFWADLTLNIDGSNVTYTTRRRRWPRSPAAHTQVSIDIGEPIEPTGLDVFLTARWGTVAKSFGRLWFHAVDHEAWTLHDATLIRLDDSAMAAPGLPTPLGEPIVRWARPVHARFARPIRV